MNPKAEHADIRRVWSTTFGRARFDLSATDGEPFMTLNAWSTGKMRLDRDEVMRLYKCLDAWLAGKEWWP